MRSATTVAPMCQRKRGRIEPIRRRRAEIAVFHRRSIPFCNALGNVLIQVRQRGCSGVRSGRRHPQRKSSVIVVGVFLLDSASPSVGNRGLGRRCQSIRFEKVRTNRVFHWLPPSLYSTTAQYVEQLLLHRFVVIVVTSLLLLLLLLLRYR